jgi:hypothetical protein
VTLALALLAALVRPGGAPAGAQGPGSTCPFPGTPTAAPYCHPYPQPRPATSTLTTVGDTTVVVTGESVFPEPAVDPFTQPPGTNFLPTIYSNVFDASGAEIPNTLPSTPTHPYNLHAAPPVVSPIDPTSPTDDLRDAFALVERLAGKPSRSPAEAAAITAALQRGIDVLEGNPVPGRAYSGLPVLHYVGPEKVKRVVPIRDSSGAVVGGNVDVHQVWYDSHIESDTAFVDPSAVQDVPWTVTYTVDVLDRGEDDFSPFVMYVDPTGGKKLPGIAMDQTFFPMEDGTRTVFVIAMAPGRYFNLVYTWGWRYHPPRVQVFENALKKLSVGGGRALTLPQWERAVFGATPRASEAAKLRAIAKIGTLAPEKQMWLALRAARAAAGAGDWELVVGKVRAARASFDDWRDRTRLPRAGTHRISVDPGADLTLLYVNNTLYAEFTDRNATIEDAQRIDFSRWKRRGTTLRVTLYNGDFFLHGYQNVDFGGARGWENQFQSTVALGGSGCWFTFGRVHWWPNIPNTGPTPHDPSGDLAVVVPAATQDPYLPGVHKVQITFRYEPSRRLRFYQFDPLHHDVAVLSIH